MLTVLLMVIAIYVGAIYHTYKWLPDYGYVTKRSLYYLHVDMDMIMIFVFSSRKGKRKVRYIITMKEKVAILATLLYVYMKR